MNSDEAVINLRASVYTTNVVSDHQLEIVFRDLSYSVPVKNKQKVVLNSISGRFRPGRLTVILGSSGAGKTTLLSLIGGEARGGVVSGEIMVNGYLTTGEDISKYSAFVFQEDIILDTQKVREAITMSATLRLPDSITADEKNQRVEDVIGLMSLNRAADTFIGSSMIKGVSGGEKKRAAIAMELVTDPPIIFLDEPTSGLDTLSAYTTVKYLKALANAGRTVVATLHQPSSEIFHMVDDLILLSEGKILYCGDAEDSVAYFAAQGYPCPQYSNPADFFFMSVLNNAKDNDSSDNIKEKKEDKTTKLASVWPRTSQGQVLKEAVDNPWSENTSEYDPPPKFRTGFLRQFRFLLGRSWNNAMRNKMAVRAKLGQAVVLAVLIDIIFWQIPDRDGNSQIQNRAGVLFFMIVNNVMGQALNNLTLFSSERVVFQREYHARMYGLPAYFLSKVMVDLPFQIIIPLIYVLILYFALGLQLTVGKFIVTFLAVVLLAGSGSAIGLWGAATFSNLSVALAMIPLILIPLMIFSGLFVNLSTVPAWIRWFQWLSPMKYGFVALMRNEFIGLEFGCGKGGFPAPSNGTMCTVRDGEAILEQFGIADMGTIAQNLLALMGYWLALILLAYLGLLRLVKTMKSSVKSVDPSMHMKMQQ